MNRSVIRSRALLGLTAAAVLTAAACSSSGSSSPGTGSSSSGSGTSGMGTKTLVVEHTQQAPNADTFNPFNNNAGGGQMHCTDLIYEPLFFFNVMKLSLAPSDNLLGTGFSWSNGNKTLTVTTRSGVKWSDGQPVSAASSGPNTAVLTFAQPEVANLFQIGTQPIVSQHVWQSVSDPANYADTHPVGTGPYVLDTFSPQGILLKANPTYWNKSSIHVPKVDFPGYTSGTAAQTALTSGQIDWAGNDISNVQSVWVGANPATNHTWFSQAPYVSANNVATLWLNVTKAPLNDPKVRQAISYAINRNQLSAQGETGYELPATSSSGLLLPLDQPLLAPQYANDLPSAGDANKAASILTSDGYAKVG